MGKKTEKAKPPELKVAFDTNVLYTGSANDLMKQEVADLIRANSHHADLKTTWYLPEIVRHERQYQMLSRAKEFLPSIQKLERLLGHNLNITEEIISRRVNDTIEEQFSELGIQLLSLRTGEVDWARLSLDSAYRRPPFSTAEGEKGFRDALIAESVLQLVADSPVTPKVCRIAVVTEDELLGGFLRAKTADHSNVRILANLEELKGLITTLVSEVSEEFVTSIASAAKSYFFEPNQADSLIRREKIREQIQERFQKQLSEMPESANRRQNGKWYVFAPRFVKKVRQRVHWGSRIEVEAKAYKTEAESPWFAALRALQAYQTWQGTTQPEQQQIAAPITQPTLVSSGQVPLSSEPRERLIAQGRTAFLVIWSVSITTTRKFASPRIEQIEYLKTTWEK